MSAIQWLRSYRHPKWVKVVFGVVGTTVAFLIAAAHLTLDVPEAASRWLAWLVRAQRLLPAVSFLFGFLIAWGLAWLIIMLSAWGEARRGVPIVAHAGQLSVRPFLDNLTYAWPAHSPEEKLAAGLSKRTFAVLYVSNDGAKNLSGLVARCSAAGTENEIYCVWSKESGDRFVVGGSHATDLNVGDFKLLVIAQALGSGAWVRLEGREMLFKVPFETKSPGEDGVIYISSYSGNRNRLNLGSELEVAVRFRAEGLDQTESFRLSFESGRPVIAAAPSRLP